MRTASCACGEVRLVAEGPPERVSVCHCLACQQRTGSAFGVQAVFRQERVAASGAPGSWVRAADSGNEVTFRFCGACGGTVWWTIEGRPEVVLVAVGAFADPTFPAPTVSVYEERRHPWCTVPDGPGVLHLE